ncbi:MAG TPA: response regulator [Candidatus Ozemobacteraceae bacterium]|nr:response regulator [Candidatus Ozemobacteraceae bacterium]
MNFQTAGKALQLRILVVEDDRDANDLLQQTLSDEGYSVEQAFDGLQGLEAVARFQPDLMLLDVMMPQMDGIELCRKLRADPKTRSLPVLLLTAKDSLTEKISGFEAGGDDYITKPFVIGELLARIKAHLRIQKLKNDLELSEARYRSLIEQSPDALLLLSPHLELLFHNSRFIELLKGRTTEALTGRELTALYPVSDLFQEIAAVASDANRTATPIDRTVQLSASNKRALHLEVRCSPIKNATGETAMLQVVIRDVTQRRSMEEALIQAEKINSLGILTAGIAHEVNNPLTGISNAVQLLRKIDLNGRRREELCDLILSNIGRIAKIVKDLHIFARGQDVSPEVFYLQDAIGETVKLVHYQDPEHRVEIEWDPPREKMYIFGDPHQFQQVLINLLLNAVQAITGPGHIKVTLERQDLSARIEVNDTGCGIPASQLGRVFDPFYTTKRDWKGTGLGLAVSFRIIQLFKGSLAVQSTVGKGSTFVITLPLYQRPA